MITLILWLLLPHPIPAARMDSPGREQNPGPEWYDPARDPCARMEAGEWHRCQPREVRLGKWDVRPAPKDWPANADVDASKSWPEYATEKRD